ncbi:MAG: bifunctional YncE family protein/alkaline phosphatase family protein [Chlorobi bacterium]|nr:bifunctional YncE family protein/alkaline phosphatase family protein [Chlorobiota bacterium]
MPYNKILQPAGKMIFFGDTSLENHALDAAVSPDGNFVAVEGRYSIVFIETATDKIIYRLTLRDQELNTMNTYSGIKWFSYDSVTMLFWGTRNAVIRASWDGKKAVIMNIYRFEPTGEARASLPNETVITTENGHPVFFVVLNGNDRIAKLDLDTDQVLWQKETGLAPYGMVLANGKLYITNWAGSIPYGDSLPTAGIPWGKAFVDAKTGAVSSGSVSIMNPENGEMLREIGVGLHPNDIVAGPAGQYVYIANGNDDNITVINTKTDQVTEVISVRLQQEDNPYYGDSPDGLAVSTDGRLLYVANGMDNALAVIRLGKQASSRGTEMDTQISGYIPTGAYPGGIALLEDKKLYVANIEGIGARLVTENKLDQAYQTTVKGKKISTAGFYNAHRMLASVSVIPVPDKKQLATYTKTVIHTNRLSRIKLSGLLPRKDRKPVPVPERIGEPSVFKHVIYIIKENRTYDQVLGDMDIGNGEPYLCAFGKAVTPNTHKLATEFSSLDRYEASGKCSAEGHLWTDASIVTDYIEKNVRAWFRSYTHVLYDAMAYPKTGFLWDNVLDHGLSVRIYGEAMIPVWNSGKKWTDIYHDFLNGIPFEFTNKTTIDRVKGILSPGYPGYDSHNIPDILRAKAFINELHDFEKMKDDAFPALSVIALPNDHTAGTSPGFPTPRAMVADNDLALGQIIEALSKSRFWKNSVVFVTEDDSQSGWDHVSAYRTVGLIISPYSRIKNMVHTPYNQTSMIKTIEYILGLPPMNIEDATANPMTDVFSNEPDFSPFVSLKNNIPLDEMNPALSSLNRQEKYFAEQSLRLAEMGIDAGEDDLMNRIIWSSFRKHKPYPKRFAGKENDD